MAIPDGKPATDFSAMNREWVRGVAAEAAAAGGLPSVSGSDNGKVLTVVSGEWEAATPSGGSGIPAPANPSDGDVLTYSSSDSAWVAAAPSGGELDSAYFFVEFETNPDPNDTTWYTRTVATAKEILDAMDAGKILIGKPGDMFNCGDAGNDKYYLTLTTIVVDIPASTLAISATHFEHVDAADIATAHFIENDDSLYQEWTVAMTPSE